MVQERGIPPAMGMLSLKKSNFLKMYDTGGSSKGRPILLRFGDIFRAVPFSDQSIKFDIVSNNVLIKVTLSRQRHCRG